MTRSSSDTKDAVLTLRNGSGSITLDDQFSTVGGGIGIDEIEFADGTIWNRAAILAAVGGTGGSTINGTSGADTLTGTSAAEAINGLGGNDVLNGLGGADTLDGGAGNDTLNGGAGDDVLTDGSGADLIDGGDGIDTVSFAGSSAGVDVYMWDDGIGGDAEGDRYQNIEAVIGSAYNDRLFGQDSVGETMKGGAGNDELYGNGGNDFLEGEAGNDFLQGGTGNDTFAFRTGFGKDVITDFTTGAGSVDVVQFASSVFANYAAVYAAATQSGSDVLITVDSANTLTLKNVALSSLHADDFRFV